MKNLLLYFLFISLFTPPVVAGEVSLLGNHMQGGLIFGMTEPGNRVDLNGQSLTVSVDGHFLFGFGRNAKKEAILRVTGLDGVVIKKVLRVAPRVYKTQRINGLPSRTVIPKHEDIVRIRAENTDISRVRSLNTNQTHFLSGFLWPVKGRISGVFGSQRILNGKPKSPHNGVDIAAPEGTIIVAPADGIAALVHQDMFYTGKTLMLDHGFGLTTVYAHMSALLVEQGNFVKQGTPIGKVGKTGRATGPHLHWGLTLNHTHLDPALVVGEIY